MAGTLIVGEGLGNSAYLVDLGGLALRALAVLPDGPLDWADATGLALERGA